MNKTKNILFYGFLLLCSIHWGGLVLAALSSNLTGLFISYENLPWFELIIFIVEIFFASALLDRMADKIILNSKTSLKLSLVAIALLLLSEFRYLYEYSPGYCGLSLINGELDSIFDKRAENNSLVNYSKAIILAISIFVYARFDLNRNTD